MYLKYLFATIPHFSTNVGWDRLIINEQSFNLLAYSAATLQQQRFPESDEGYSRGFKKQKKKLFICITSVLISGGAEGSSSSSETSPPSGSVGRKPYQTRKGKLKATPINKRHVRSSSGYSSHNEETTFSISHAPSFNERIHPPSRFSDLSTRNLSESEYEKGHKPLRGMSKLSREAFQINV